MAAILERIADNRFEYDDLDVVEYLRDLSVREPSIDEIASLAVAIAESSLPSHSVPALDLARNDTDVPSTGGPASLTTVATPLILASGGLNILKISERGRPAGAIDVFEVIPGFVSQLSPLQISELAQRARYIHIRQSPEFAPADRKLIQIRRTHGLMKSAPLAVASLLAKKICVGIRSFVVDLRVGIGGNVADNFDEAREAARIFVATARQLGVRVRCILTDATTFPPSPYIGRSEALRGLIDLLASLRQEDAHAEAVMTFASECSDLAGAAATFRKSRRGRVGEDPIGLLAELLQPQGVSLTVLRSRVDSIMSFVEIPIRSTRRGIIVAVDSAHLKRALLRMYAALGRDEFSIWDVGLFWRATLGAIAVGDELATFRASAASFEQLRSEIQAFEAQLNDALTFGTDATVIPEMPTQIFGVVDEFGNFRPPLKQPDGTA